MKTAARIWATFFGVGLVPLAPGTAASAAAAGLFALGLWRLPAGLYGGLLAGLFLSGVPAAGAAARAMDRRDPRPVVIDEVCGQLLALAAAPRGWPAVAAGFLLFRLFDIAKPFPIRRLENLPAGWGIMADDILAGLYSLALLQLGLRLFR